MKKILALVVLALLAFTALYVLAPYRAVKALGDATANNEGKKAAEYIDFEKVRASMKENIHKGLQKDGPKEKGLGNLIAEIATKALGDVAVEAIFNEKSFIALIRAKSKEEKANAFEEFESEFKGLKSFVVKNKDLMLTLENQGIFDWKVTQIDTTF